MSEALSSGNFESDFITQPPRWWGRIVSKESYSKNTDASTFQGVYEKPGWGYRYKVRIFSWHSGKVTEVKDIDLPMANVVLPVTAGSGIGGAATSPSLEPGSIVTGFFMDGIGGQEPWIDGVLGNSNNNIPKKQGGKSPTNKPTRTPPTNLQNLRAAELKEYLNPARTPTSFELKAAQTARQKARAAGLPTAEVERQVLIATIQAKQLEAAPTEQFLGYSAFNDTYSDSSKNPSKVADFCRFEDAPVSTFDAVHVTTVAATTQDEDRKREQALLSVCKEDNSETKATSVVLSNLINDIQRAKRFAQDTEELAVEVENLIESAVPAISSYLKSILSQARAYINNEISKAVEEKVTKLFPTDATDLKKAQEKALDALSCFFNNLIEGLADLIKAAIRELINLLINTPLCAAESFLSGLLDQLFALINGVLPTVLSALSVVLGGIRTINVSVQQFAGALTPILNLFTCDPAPDCPAYDQISLAGLAIPGGIDFGVPSAPVCPIFPQVCGAPTVFFFGNTINRALANPIVSPISNALIAFDIIDPGQYSSQPFAVVLDQCGTGSGAVVEPILVDGQIQNVAILNPGDGYLYAPDGSLGGNGVTWKKPYECYVKTAKGEYFVVPYGQEPPELGEGDELICPPEEQPPAISYPVILCLDSILVADGGFGYTPGDEIIITPDNGSVVEPVINDRGQITEVKVISGACGYTDLPDIRTNSETGFNAQLIPVLRPQRVEDIAPEVLPPGVEVIQVIDCVGKILPKTTFDIVPR